MTEEWNLFHEKNPSGKIAKADAMAKLKEAAAARFPNAIPEAIPERLFETISETIPSSSSQRFGSKVTDELKQLTRE